MMGGADPDDGKEEERSDETFEPTFYHHLPESLYSDAIGAYEIRGCLDLTPGCGDLARACLLGRVPYLGLGMSDLHCSLLKAQLVDFVKMLMRSEGSTFYSPEWAAAASEARLTRATRRRRSALLTPMPSLNPSSLPRSLSLLRRPRKIRKMMKSWSKTRILLLSERSLWESVSRWPLNWPIWVAAPCILLTCCWSFIEAWSAISAILIKTSNFHWLISSHIFDLANLT